MTENMNREFDLLAKAGVVLIALQIAIFAKMVADLGFDRASDNYPVLVMATALFVGSQRKLLARPPNHGAARWILASRIAVLSLLTLGTLTIGFYRLMPDAVPPPELTVRGMFSVMWVIIALKGAAIGKLKPGSAMGLCVPWTKQSRLAWDRGHRTLGRVLFWGGLIGLSASLIVAPLTSITMWVSTVALAVALALYESWRTWRIDPDRPGGHAT